MTAVLLTGLTGTDTGNVHSFFDQTWYILRSLDTFYSHLMKERLNFFRDNFRQTEQVVIHNNTRNKTQDSTLFAIHMPSWNFLFQQAKPYLA